MNNLYNNMLIILSCLCAESTYSLLCTYKYMFMRNNNVFLLLYLRISNILKGHSVIHAIDIPILKQIYI